MKVTNSCSSERFVKFTFAAIYASVKLPPWKMKFTLRCKFTPG